MKVGEAIQRARKKAGLTQEQLAARVFVTRQAVSRWETGESEPGIDMRKLLAQTLDASVVEMLELPDSPACQCCGTPFDIPNMPLGTNEDGSPNPDYCKWCYENGRFTDAGLDEMIERNAPYLMQATGYTQEEAISFMGAVIPTLKRWKTSENKNKSANCRRSLLHVCPACNNVIWSTGNVAISCCGNTLEPLRAVRNEDILDASVALEEGCLHAFVSHPMTKEDHLLFIAAIGDDLVRIKRLYPEQEARAEFYMQGRCRLYAYGNDCGLVEIYG